MDQRAPTHQAVAMKAPPKLPKSAVVIPAAQKFVPRPRELSVIVPSAPPMPTPLPQASPLVALPQSPIALPSAALVSVRITPRPTIAPTAAPTVAPTQQPTLAPTAQPSPAPTAQPSPAPTSAPTQAPTTSPTTSPTSAPRPAASAAPKSAPSPGPARISRGTPGPNAKGGPKAVHVPNLIRVAPSPKPARSRPTPKPRSTPGTPGNLNALIPHDTVLPQNLKRYGPNYGAMSGGYAPTPPPDVRDQTQYLYRTSGIDRLEMWVTRVTSGALAARCYGWLVRFPQGPPSQAAPPSKLAPTIIFGGGGGPTQAGRAVDPIIVGMATIPCRRSALAPYRP